MKSLSLLIFTCAALLAVASDGSRDAGSSPLPLASAKAILVMEITPCPVA